MQRCLIWTLWYRCQRIFQFSSCFEPIDVVTLRTPWWPQLHSTYHWPQVSSIYFMRFLWSELRLFQTCVKLGRPIKHMRKTRPEFNILLRFTQSVNLWCYMLYLHQGNHIRFLLTKPLYLQLVTNLLSEILMVPNYKRLLWHRYLNDIFKSSSEFTGWSQARGFGSTRL